MLSSISGWKIRFSYRNQPVDLKFEFRVRNRWKNLPKIKGRRFVFFFVELKRRLVFLLQNAAVSAAKSVIRLWIAIACVLKFQHGSSRTLTTMCIFVNLYKEFVNIVNDCECCQYSWIFVDFWVNFSQILTKKFHKNPKYSHKSANIDNIHKNSQIFTFFNCFFKFFSNFHKFTLFPEVHHIHNI